MIPSRNGGDVDTSSMVNKRNPSECRIVGDDRKVHAEHRPCPPHRPGGEGTALS